VKTRIAIALAAAVLTTAGLTIAISPAQAARVAVTCGTWRWPVKTGSDADRHKVSRRVRDTTIRHLRSLKAPGSFAGHQDRRFRGAERHTWQLSTVLTQYREEDDGDIHLVIKNSSGKKMIAEIPLGRCVSSRSLWKRQIASARTTFTRHLHLTTSWHYVHRKITLRGLGFFDEIHDVTGQAPNGIELHPVIRVRFP
jgi:hypothetical protein